MSPTSATSLFSDCFKRGTKTLTSGVFPLFEIAITKSSACSIPRSPCIASAACRKIEGVPVEFRVATIFCAIMALLPIPVIITRPFIAKISFTTLTKSSSILSVNFRTASASIVRVETAIDFISELVFTKYFFIFSMELRQKYVILSNLREHIRYLYKEQCKQITHSLIIYKFSSDLKSLRESKKQLLPMYCRKKIRPLSCRQGEASQYVINCLH